MKQIKSSKSVILAAFSANLFIAVVKFLVAWVTASSAMLAEAIHSSADTLNQILLFVGIKKAAKKAELILVFLAHFPEINKIFIEPDIFRKR